MGGGGKDGCTSCITRTPYATLIALIMCWAGVGVFCGTMYRGVNLTLRLLQDVFKLDRGLQWWVMLASKIEILVITTQGWANTASICYSWCQHGCPGPDDLGHCYPGHRGHQGGGVQEQHGQGGGQDSQCLLYTHNVSIITILCLLLVYHTLYRYILLLAWLVVLTCCIVMTTFYTLSWGRYMVKVEL